MNKLTDRLPERAPIRATPEATAPMPLAAPGLSSGAPAIARDDGVIDLGALYNTIWRGKWLIALITALAVLAGGYYAFGLAVPKYRSTAVVILEPQQSSIVAFDSVVPGLTGDTSEVNYEVEVLSSS